jgi:hypothetical protein
VGGHGAAFAVGSLNGDVGVTSRQVPAFTRYNRRTAAMPGMRVSLLDRFIIGLITSRADRLNLL